MSAESGPHLSISFQVLQQLDALASDKIESLEDATAYVQKSAALCVFGDPGPFGAELESRLAAAELEAAGNPSKLIPDDKIAEAFNFMSNEFGVDQPAQLTGEDIHQFRSVQASIWPHLFSPKSVDGSRPVSAVMILYQLWFNGGITEGVRNAAKLDRPPGSLKISGGRIVGQLGENGRTAQKEYRAAGYSYFAQRSPQKVRFFLDQLAEVIEAFRKGGPVKTRKIICGALLGLCVLATCGDSCLPGEQGSGGFTVNTQSTLTDSDGNPITTIPTPGEAISGSWLSDDSGAAGSVCSFAGSTNLVGQYSVNIM